MHNYDMTFSVNDTAKTEFKDSSDVILQFKILIYDCYQ